MINGTTFCPTLLLTYTQRLDKQMDLSNSCEIVLPLVSMCYKTECSAVLITFKWLSTFVYLSFAERHLRGSHKGLTFNIISPSNNSFFSQMNPSTLHFGKYLPQLISDRSGHISGRSCLHSFFLLFIPVFLECLSVFLGKLSVYKHVQSRGGDKKRK